ncbi:hypothetical protein H310_10445 [Aphanomyces invadans]|uniref:Uncharacterized protein n=1 Tax=Aphanomyces invadans TaxID=157072 RepID=A0A024TRL7_9STRA|nr:hypothetical protein H310_10445 [Aphanomyces invadans]ETV96271.1 hypothetical protein H310_10445 [Aphanomyces invadans]|eukprot:XP_008875063.1 hypothetical protein H310_10445 [Aphanomyces invadans]
MPTPVPAFDILVSSKDEVVRDMALLAEELWDVASMAHGPTGRCIVIQPNKDCGDACIVTSSAKRIMEHLRLTSSMGTLFAQYVQSHLKQHRDGGLFCIMLASSMLRRVHSALESIPKHRLFSGLRLAQDWALDELHDMQDDLDWSDAEAIAAVVRGIVSPKFVANVSESTVATLMQVFVQHLPWLLEHPTIPPIVRVVASRQRLPGVNDVVMHHTVLIPGRRHVTHLPLRNVKVVLFNVTIRPSPTPTSDIEVTVKVDSETYHSVMAPSTSGLVQEAEMAGWTAVTKRLKSCGVQMVLSQKKIPAFLAARLSDVGIASIERLSIQHIDAVQAVTGAAILSDWTATELKEADLGMLDHAYALELSGVTYIALTCDPASPGKSAALMERTRPMSTIAMDVIDDMALEETDHVVQVRRMRSECDDDYRHRQLCKC